MLLAAELTAEQLAVAQQGLLVAHLPRSLGGGMDDAAVMDQVCGVQPTAAGSNICYTTLFCL